MKYRYTITETRSLVVELDDAPRTITSSLTRDPLAVTPQMLMSHVRTAAEEQGQQWTDTVSVLKIEPVA